jgi:cleavage stimulation factor subunit 3
MAYSWAKSITTTSGKQDEALSLLEAGIKANPSSFLLNFAYAEGMELKNDFAKVRTTFEAFLAILRADLDDLKARVDATAAAAAANASAANADTTLTTEPNTSGVVNTTINSQASMTSTADEESKRRELAEKRTEYGLVYIMYMRFSRRAEGQAAWRLIFRKARMDTWTPWEVYEAAALMEYHCSKDVGVAGRIFEKGEELFGDEIEFVTRHLGFLISINDQNSVLILLFTRYVG